MEMDCREFLTNSLATAGSVLLASRGFPETLPVAQQPSDLCGLPRSEAHGNGFRPVVRACRWREPLGRVVSTSIL
jgi:hypothetical protein